MEEEDEEEMEEEEEMKEEDEGGEDVVDESQLSRPRLQRVMSTSMRKEESAELPSGPGTVTHRSSTTKRHNDGKISAESNVTFESLEARLLPARKRMLVEVTRVADALAIGPPAALQLLLARGFDSEALISELANSSGSEGLQAALVAAGIVLTEEASAAAAASGSGGNTLLCGICYDELEMPKPAGGFSMPTMVARQRSEYRSPAFALCCNHAYCQDCWKHYIRVQVCEKRSVTICCPTEDCEAAVLEDFIGRVVPAPASALGPLRDTNTSTDERAAGDGVIRTAYARELVKHYVEAEAKRSHRLELSFCKNPRGCEGVLVLATGAGATAAQCDECTHRYCAYCDDFGPHFPASCSDMVAWEKAGGFVEPAGGGSGDNANREMIQKTTKPCPKCGRRIEKNGGCTHMTCKREAGGCGYDFCWECMGEYHTTGACERVKVEGKPGSHLHFDKLDRRCANHMMARRLAVRNRDMCLRILAAARKKKTLSPGDGGGVAVAGEQQLEVDNYSVVTSLALEQQQQRSSGSHSTPTDTATLEFIQVMQEGWEALAHAQEILAHTTVRALTHVPTANTADDAPTFCRSHRRWERRYMYTREAQISRA